MFYLKKSKFNKDDRYCAVGFFIFLLEKWNLKIAVY